MFEFVEEPFDEVSLAIEGRVDRPLSLAISLRRDMSATALVGDEIDEALPVVAAVADNVAEAAEAVEQCRRGGLVGSLPGRQQKLDRQAVAVDDGMKLGAQSPARATDGVIRTPFLPPAAC